MPKSGNTLENLLKRLEERLPSKNLEQAARMESLVDDLREKGKRNIKIECLDDFVRIFEYPREKIEERFWSLVKERPKGNCWLWCGTKMKIGYGAFSLVGTNFYAHRISYLLSNDFLPGNLLVMHTCDVRNCVNPSHLVAGDHKDNLRDAINKGRNLVGVKNGHAKITPEQVLAIRREYVRGVVTMDMLGKKYGVGRSNVGFILSRHSWSHI